ncbi:hypothetical protein NX801_18135 [Streptomyces sp. LP05-1]|uniref:Integral membrane protein n=1 Tax=Streptomyces pyxinae TaxID=2970734 RepID=A0ABT2CJG5_9ACTN|nr:hypothetical protein [Streptomyces sp. LP05-1]MCS0637548.1 hypothetical protein [Streptomyces sp. LP05-1]
MSVAVRWFLAVAASVLVFFLIAVPWALVVPGGDDPWDVIAPVAGVFAAGALAGLGWWAAQGGSGNVYQSAETTGTGDIEQIGGNRGGTAGSSPASVRQKAKGGGNINQVGGNRS